jgi:neutral amino acid transport system permease protein
MDFVNQLFIDFGQQILSSVTAAFAIAAIGLNVHFGYTGLINIGQAGFMLVGAYGLAITVELGGGFWLGVLIALVAAVIFALVLGLPTLKLRGDYLAIVTIAAAEIVRVVGDNQSLSQWTGGAAGIPGRVYQGTFTALSPFPQNGAFQLGPYNYPLTEGDSWFLRIATWIVLALVAVLVYLLMRSPWGRAIKGIREDEDAMRSLGKNVYLYNALRAVGVGAGRLARPHHHVPALHLPAARRRGDRARPRARLGAVLHRDHRPERRGQPVRAVVDHERAADPAVRVDRCRYRPHAARHLPAAGHPREQEGAGLR